MSYRARTMITGNKAKWWKNKGRRNPDVPRGRRSWRCNTASWAGRSPLSAAWRSQSRRSWWTRRSRSRPHTGCYWASGLCAPPANPAGRQSHGGRLHQLSLSSPRTHVCWIAAIIQIWLNLLKTWTERALLPHQRISNHLLLYCHSLFVLFDCCMMEKWAYFIFKSVSSVVQWTLHACMLAACHSLLYPPL